METESLNQQPESHYDGEEVEREAVLEVTEENEPVQTTHYFKSGDFAELIVCGVFFLLCVSANAADGALRMRPIPFQLLGNGLYVENQVNSEDYSGQETIPGELCELLFVSSGLNHDPLLFLTSLLCPAPLRLVIDCFGDIFARRFAVRFKSILSDWWR